MAGKKIVFILINCTQSFALMVRHNVSRSLHCELLSFFYSSFLIGCHKAVYYCFRHNKLIPSQQQQRQRRWFSIYSRFFLFFSFLLLLSQSKTRRHLFRWKENKKKNRISYLFWMILTNNNIQSVQFRSHHISIIAWKA